MKGNIMSKYKTQGQEDCADCEWLAEETDGQTLICNECALEQNVAEFNARNSIESDEVDHDIWANEDAVHDMKHRYQ